MRTLRLPSGVAAPVLLVGLVVLLGTLQYRWLGKVSEAEREQLRQSLDRRAREFADDFDGEVGRLYLSLQVENPLGDRPRSPVAAALERWQATARFPQLLAGLYLAQQDETRWTLRRYDLQHGRFDAASDAWPAPLGQVREQLANVTVGGAMSPGTRRQVLAITIGSVVSGAPALVIPIPAPVAGAGLDRAGASADGPPRSLPPMPGPGDRLFVRWPSAYLVVQLDAEYLRRSALPALVARHFPEEGAAAYRVAVLSDAGRIVFARGFGSSPTVDPKTADIVVPFFNLRLDTARDALPASGRTALSEGPAKDLPEGEGQRVAVLVEHRAAESGKARVEGRIRIVRPSWRIVLQHPAGSLDTAVAQARTRNLWVGFGTLGVLAAGVVLVVTNARRASQLAAREMDVVATVSHELRTPIAVIRSAAQNLSAGVVSEAGQARRYGELIEDQGRRLTETVEQVLAYAAIRGGQAPLRRREPVDVQVLVDELSVAWRPLCEQAGVTLEVRASAHPLPPVVGDEVLLRRALDNLIVNAVKHAADGCWVGVSVAVEMSRGRPFVCVTVSDRGAGIPPADLPHVFDPFFRGRQAVERQVPGNGLGLSLVKRVAAAHQGGVSVRSEAGRGATFRFRVRARADAAPSIESPGPSAGAEVAG